MKWKGIEKKLVFGILLLMIIGNFSSIIDVIAEQTSQKSELINDIMNSISEREKFLNSFQSEELFYTENKGQFPKEVLFQTHMNGAGVYLCRDKIVSVFLRESPNISMNPRTGQDLLAAAVRQNKTSTKMEVLSVVQEFVHANLNSVIVGENKLSHYNNYFIGNDSAKWYTDVPNYQAVRYENIYPGIDLRYHAIGSSLKYDFIVQPRVDFSQIAINFLGVENMMITPEGDVNVITTFGSFFEKAPLVYQNIKGIRQEIEGRYSLTGNHLGFTIGIYNHEYPLIIDPYTLSFSTFIGAGAADIARDIEIDNMNRPCIVGWTYSSFYPTVNPYQGSIQANSDIVLSILSESGSSLLYSTFIGGSGEDEGWSIAIRNQYAFITGITYSSNFPTKSAYDTSFNGNSDAFVARFNLQSSGSSSLIYSTFLGGTNYDFGFSIVADTSNYAYVAGQTGSSGFPVLNAYDNSYNGAFDAFVTKVAPVGTSLVYSTFLGGTSSDGGFGIALDGSNNAYISGGTDSSNFPTINAYDSSYNGNGDCFVTRLSSTGSSLHYSTYLGGSDIDIGCNAAITVDSSNNAYVTGDTFSSNFPTYNAYDSSYNGLRDCFITKLSSGGTSLQYSTFLGGSDEDVPYSITVDTANCAYVTGDTYSSNFPTYDAYDASYNGIYDAFVTKFSSAGTTLLFSTYLGGSDSDTGCGITIDGTGSAYIGGGTFSSGFPSTSGAYDTSFNGGEDVFVTKISPLRTITFYTDPSSQGSITFDGSTYTNGQTTTKIDGQYSATAIIPSGYMFYYWSTSGGVSVADENSPTTIVAVSGSDGHLKAWFIQPTPRTITFYTNPSSQGSITFAGSTYINGQTTTKIDGQYTATANPGTNYYFNHWSTSGGVSVSDENSQSTTVTITGSGFLKAWFTFQPTYRIEVIVDPMKFGNVSIDGNFVNSGNSIDLIEGTYPLVANPNSYAQFDHWSTTDHVSVSDPYSYSTSVTISGPGSIQLSLKIFYFVALSDIHYGYHNFRKTFQGQITTINNLINELGTKPNFITIAGDLVSFGQGCDPRYIIPFLYYTEEENNSYYWLKYDLDNYLDQDIPYYLVPGNHDGYVYPFFYETPTNFYNFFPNMTDPRSIHLPDLNTNLILLNSGGDALDFLETCIISPRGSGFSDGTISWLENNIYDDLFKIIVMHHPTIYNGICYTPEWGCDDGCWNVGTIIDNREEFKTLNEQHDIDLVLSGHNHGDGYITEMFYKYMDGVDSQGIIEFPASTDSTVYGCSLYSWIFANYSSNQLDVFSGPDMPFFLQEHGTIRDGFPLASNPFPQNSVTLIDAPGILRIYNNDSYSGINETGYVHMGIENSTYYIEPIPNPENKTEYNYDLGYFMWNHTIQGATNEIDNKEYTYIFQSYKNGNTSIALTSTPKDGSYTSAIFRNVPISNTSVSYLFMNETSTDLTLYTDEDNDKIIDHELRPNKITCKKVPYPPKNLSYQSEEIPLAYNCSATSIDPEDDQIYYRFDWGDGNTSSWLGPYQSNETVQDTYVWKKAGNYSVRVKSKDINGFIGDWSDKLILNVQNVPPEKPTIIKPYDGEKGIGLNPSLNVRVIDRNGDAMNVTFFDASNDCEIATDYNVQNGSTASVIWPSLQYEQKYSWYAQASDLRGATNRSDTWQFVTTTIERHIPFSTATFGEFIEKNNNNNHLNSLQFEGTDINKYYIPEVPTDAEYGSRSFCRVSDDVFAFSYKYDDKAWIIAGKITEHNSSISVMFGSPHIVQDINVFNPTRGWYGPYIASYKDTNRVGVLFFPRYLDDVQNKIELAYGKVCELDLDTLIWTNYTSYRLLCDSMKTYSTGWLTTSKNTLYFAARCSFTYSDPFGDRDMDLRFLYLNSDGSCGYKILHTWYKDGLWDGGQIFGASGVPGTGKLLISWSERSTSEESWEYHIALYSGKTERDDIVGTAYNNLYGVAENFVVSTSNKIFEINGNDIVGIYNDTIFGRTINCPENGYRNGYFTVSDAGKHFLGFFNSSTRDWIVFNNGTSFDSIGDLLYIHTNLFLSLNYDCKGPYIFPVIKSSSWGTIWLNRTIIGYEYDNTTICRSDSQVSNGIAKIPISYKVIDIERVIVDGINPQRKYCYNDIENNTWFFDPDNDFIYIGFGDISNGENFDIVIISNQFDSWEDDFRTAYGILSQSNLTIEKSTARYNGSGVGELTSIAVTKPANSVWTRFFADVNDSINSSFRIIDYYNNTLESSKYRLYPDSDITVQLTPHGEASNYQCVDDMIFDDNNSYVWMANSTLKRDIYEVQNISLHEPIYSVTLNSRALYDLPQIFNGTYKIILSNGLNEIKVTCNLTNCYKTFTKEFKMNPFTGDNWNENDINSLQIGLECCSSINYSSIQKILRPSADGLYIEHSPKDYLPELPRWDCVNDITPNDDVDYIWGSGDSGSPQIQRSLFELENNTIKCGDINYIDIFVRFSNLYKTGSNMKIIISPDGSHTDNFSSGTFSLSPDGVYSTKSYRWAKNPQTSTNWTLNNINDMQAGWWSYTKWGGIQRNTQTYAIVNYCNISSEIRTTQCYLEVNTLFNDTGLSLTNLVESPIYLQGEFINSPIDLSEWGVEWYVDTIAPEWKNQGQNKTIVTLGSSVKLFAQGKDDIALDLAWLATNETGMWQNYTINSSIMKLQKNNQWQWSNFTWKNPTVPEGTRVGWRIYYQDMCGNINATDVHSFLIGSVDQVIYSIIDLGILLDDLTSTAYGINNYDQIVGFSGEQYGLHEACLWENGNMTGLGMLCNGTWSDARAINDAGVIVGSSHRQNPDWLVHAYIWDNDVMTDLGALNGFNCTSYGYDINNQDQVVGSSYLEPHQWQPPHAFLWQNEVMTDLGVLPGDTASTAKSINDIGQIIGVSSHSDEDAYHPTAFLWDAVNGMHPIPLLQGDTYSEVYDINNQGHVIGYSYGGVPGYHAFLWKNSGSIDLGTLGGNKGSIANALNNDDTVVGSSMIQDNSAQHAFIWKDGCMNDLNDLIPIESGWTLIDATGINDQGDIVGYGVNANGDIHAFLLTQYE